jgi:hypothetical protein
MSVFDSHFLKRLGIIPIEEAIVVPVYAKTYIDQNGAHVPRPLSYQILVSLLLQIDDLSRFTRCDLGIMFHKNKKEKVRYYRALEC